jgi:hypothetical protein
MPSAHESSAARGEVPLAEPPFAATVGLVGPADLWYKDAVIYSLNVETFQDSDGDGIGDFAGLTMRLDYLHGLGVSCVWLQPFYPSPGRDNRYDVADYYGVDPRLGSLGDFVDFLRLARERGIRVMRTSSATTTSSISPASDTTNARPSTLPLRPSRACACTIEAFAAGSPRCLAEIVGASSSPGASCSRCRAHR